MKCPNRACDKGKIYITSGNYDCPTCKGTGEVETDQSDLQKEGELPPIQEVRAIFKADEPSSEVGKSLGQIAMEAGLEVTPNLQWSEHSPKQKADWEHVARVVADHAVREEKSRLIRYEQTCEENNKIIHELEQEITRLLSQAATDCETITKLTREVDEAREDARSWRW